MCLTGRVWRIVKGIFLFSYSFVYFWNLYFYILALYQSVQFNLIHTRFCIPFGRVSRAVCGAHLHLLCAVCHAATFEVNVALVASQIGCIGRKTLINSVRGRTWYENVGVHVDEHEKKTRQRFNNRVYLGTAVLQSCWSLLLGL